MQINRFTASCRDCGAPIDNGQAAFFETIPGGGLRFFDVPCPICGARRVVEAYDLGSRTRDRLLHDRSRARIL